MVLKPTVAPQLPPPRTRSDVEFENQYTRLTIQNESLRNQLKVLSMQMDTVIKDRQKQAKHPPKSEAQIETTLEEHQIKQTKYESNLRKEYLQMQRKLEQLSLQPHLQSDLVHANFILQQRIDQALSNVKSLQQQQKVTSCQILKLTNKKTEN